MESKTGRKERSLKETIPKVVEQKLNKQQILASAKYTNRKDLVNALLEENKQYTMQEVEEMIEKFMKGKVR